MSVGSEIGYKMYLVYMLLVHVLIAKDAMTWKTSDPVSFGKFVMDAIDLPNWLRRTMVEMLGTLLLQLIFYFFFLRAREDRGHAVTHKSATMQRRATFNWTIWRLSQLYLLPYSLYQVYRLGAISGIFVGHFTYIVADAYISAYDYFEGDDEAALTAWNEYLATRGDDDL